MDTKKAIGAVTAVLAALLGGLVVLVVMLSGQAKINAAAKDDCVVSPSTPDSGGPVRMPLTGPFTVTSEYGMRVNPGGKLKGQLRLHAGIDLSNGAGSPIVAAKAGKVTKIPTDIYGGNMVVVDTGGGITMEYLHMSKRSVKVGDTVWAGRELGKEGSTGNVSGPHLHFEVHVDGKAVNPRPWLTEHGVKLPATGGSTTGPAVVTSAPKNSSSGGGATTASAASASPAETSAGSGESSSGGSGGVSLKGMPSSIGGYSGDQLVNAGHVIRAGKAMKLDDQTVTIGVMTAMGESALKNVGHGDAAGPDSRGLFQQRGAGWGSEADRMNPEKAATSYFKALVKVPGYKGLEPTMAAHRAQKNADAGHYRRFWEPAVQVVSTLTKNPDLLKNLASVQGPGGCAGGKPVGQAGGKGGKIPPSPSNGGTGAKIVQQARRWEGTPYSWGGGTFNGPGKGVRTSAAYDGSGTVGFDCSGLTRFAVYRGAGIKLPRTAEQQTRDTQGSPVPREQSQMRPGDVVSFSKAGGAKGSYSHIGIYIGNGQMVHAPVQGQDVTVTQLFGKPYWEKQTWTIKRYASK